jgi:hypothetical protein
MNTREYNEFWLCELTLDDYLEIKKLNWRHALSQRPYKVMSVLGWAGLGWVLGTRNFTYASQK